MENEREPDTLTENPVPEQPPTDLLVVSTEGTGRMTLSDGTVANVGDTVVSRDGGKTWDVYTAGGWIEAKWPASSGAQTRRSSPMTDPTREDRERAARALWPSAYEEEEESSMLHSHRVMVRSWVERAVPGDTKFDWRFTAAEQLAQAIATARAEGEAKGRAELGATLVRDLGAMATSLAGQSEGSTAAAFKAQAEATQREAVHLALIAELAAAASNAEADYSAAASVSESSIDAMRTVLTRARDATRNVRVIELGECEVKHAILYLGDTATPVLSPDNGAIDRAEAAALEGASGPCTAAVVVRMGGEKCIT